MANDETRPSKETLDMEDAGTILSDEMLDMSDGDTKANKKEAGGLIDITAGSTKKKVDDPLKADTAKIRRKNVGMMPPECPDDVKFSHVESTQSSNRDVQKKEPQKKWWQFWK